MYKLLYKELRLAAHPTLFMFTLLGALVAVPAYPYGLVFLFGCMGLYFTCVFGRETRDVYYTALLPLQKGDVVKGKCLLAVVSQLGQMVISVLCAVFLRPLTVPAGNPAGIEANPAYYGFGLMLYGLFNLVFFAEFYKTAHRAGRAFVLAMAPVLLGTVAMETLGHIPATAWLDSTHPADMLRQLPILLLGLALYPLCTLAACRVGEKRFDRVDL